MKPNLDKIVITGGGTGGHLAIARALSEELNLRGHKPIFIGSTSGQDRVWFENDPKFSEQVFLESSGVVNKRGLAKFSSLAQILKLAFGCRKLFKTKNVRAVISVGGYSAAPGAFGALLAGAPLFIHEQNAITGNLNKILKPFSRGFFSSYDKNAQCDYPVSERFFSLARTREQLGVVLFLGGSQGARAINELALNLAPILKAKSIKIIHQCGKNALDELQQKYTELGLNLSNLSNPANKDQNLDTDVLLFDFCADIERHMAHADLAISRAGASSLWELCANGLPAIFVPFPHAASDHQYHNAKFLQEAGLAQICRQDGSSVDSEKILNLIENFDFRAASSSLRELISKNGAKQIVDKILSQI